MARYRKIDCFIWRDGAFKDLSPADQVETIRLIVLDQAPPQFAKYAGPYWRAADSPKRRPDLYSSAWRKVRLEVIAASDGCCHHCGNDCTDDPTVDHLIPVSRGGAQLDRANLVLSCRRCNSIKGGREGWAA